MRLEGVKSAERKASAGLCCTAFCKNKAAKSKRFCHTCRSRAYTDPLLKKFLNLKSSAKRKGREFALTFDFFRDLASSTGYDRESGIRSLNLHVDRIDPLRGYLPDNVRVITAHENCRKAYVDRLRHHGVQWFDPELSPF